ncbi:polyprenol monophosphomannose synthase [Gulosibacter molinativorax]|uniref:Polyprenol monophosphomannose synthase n=1 Tax=Gulosibacter molinativorax TaxID=256821 RepID=A0ABT7CB03_9MICO|nr:polyprenol monophosphomannose synthase [Gulosibacter molinativorax]MDJ1372340.1 polyprenol monophosphomannose synthase [Gulosibacter molinativorax]QUY63570.1 Putative polyprenol-phosphate mannosyltransferase [Gulosibacter molinativorax]
MPNSGKHAIPTRDDAETQVRDILVIVPTYNERENIETVVGQVLDASTRVDVLIVDDGSPDGTGQIAESIAAQTSRVTVLHRSGKQGLASAYLEGFDVGHERGYRYLFEFDADGSHPADRLPALIDELDGGADLVIGSRWVPGGATENWPLNRKLLSRAASLYCRFALKSDIRDITAGYRGFRASELRKFDLAPVRSAGYCFQIEMAWMFERVGKRVVEVPITFAEREFGTSKMSRGIIIEAFWRVGSWGLGYRARGLEYRLTGK